LVPTPSKVRESSKETELETGMGMGMGMGMGAWNKGGERICLYRSKKAGA
jgi:hypothetical protein